MTIVRTINGTTFHIKLLPEELIEAFFEQRDKFDIEDIVSYAEEIGSKELKATFGCTYQEYLNMKEEMAEEMRRNMDKYDMSFADAREYAIREVLKRNLAAV